MFVMGLSGDVGSGKTTLVNTWAGMGATVISADEVAKRQWQKPPIARAAVDRWGDSVVTEGKLDYAKIASVGFSNEDEYHFMAALIHPGTRADIKRAVDSAHGWIVVEIPLLFESGHYDWLDYIVYVNAPLEQRVVRNEFRGWDANEVARRERFMLESARKRELSDLVLPNCGSLEKWRETAHEYGRLFGAMASVCEVVTFCASSEDAEKIASGLVEERLAASVNIGMVGSIYRWKDNIEREAEWELRCKTAGSASVRAREYIKENHPYELPAIYAQELSRANAEMLKWVVESCDL